MRWIKELYCLRRLRNLQEVYDKKLSELSYMRGRLSDLNYDVIRQYRKSKPKTMPSIDGILNDDTPEIISLKMSMLLESEKIKRSEDEIREIRSEIYDCKRFLGVRD